MSEVSFRFQSGRASCGIACLTNRVEDLVRQACERFPVLQERRKQAAGTLSGEPTAGIEPRVAGMIYAMIKDLATQQGKAVLLVDQNIKRALEIADYVYVMRTGTVLSEGSRDEFGGDTEALVARWLYASGNVEWA